MATYRHWNVRRDESRIAWITLDVADSPMNKLSADVMSELDTLLDDLDRYPPAGAVFQSGKDAGFIAGADIEEFTRLDSPEKARSLVLGAAQALGADDHGAQCGCRQALQHAVITAPQFRDPEVVQRLKFVASRVL